MSKERYFLATHNIRVRVYILNIFSLTHFKHYIDFLKILINVKYYISFIDFISRENTRQSFFANVEKGSNFTKLAFCDFLKAYDMEI